MIRETATGLVLLGLILPVTAAGIDKFTPARFADTENPFPDLIDFPGAKKDVDVRMKCDTVITTEGELTRVICYGPDRYKMSYKNAIYDVIRDIEFVPATVNEKPVTVVMQFTLHFVRDDGAEEIFLYPNSGDDEDRYGTDYVGVQRYDWGQWSSHGCRGHHRRFVVSSRTTVGADGSYKDHMLLKGEQELGPCEDDINEHIRSGSYIPATKNGVPVEAKFVETFLNYLDPKVSY